MPAEYTQRGFAIYAELRDDYDARVRVMESSAATVEGEDCGPWVWIFVDGGHVEGNDGAAHLAPEQARQVRDALTEWLDALGEEQRRG